MMVPPLCVCVAVARPDRCNCILLSDVYCTFAGAHDSSELYIRVRSLSLSPSVLHRELTGSASSPNMRRISPDWNTRTISLTSRTRARVCAHALPSAATAAARRARARSRRAHHHSRTWGMCAMWRLCVYCVAEMDGLP